MLAEESSNQKKIRNLQPPQNIIVLMIRVE
jgi:hypothetical protein